MVLILSLSLRIGCVFLHDVELSSTHRMQYCATVKRSFVCFPRGRATRWRWRHRKWSLWEFHERYFAKVSEVPGAIGEHDALPRDYSRLFWLDLRTALHHAKPTRKWMYFFRHCFRRFPFTVVYAHSFSLSTLTRPSFPLSSASLHRKRITFFFPRVGDFRICFRKQRATAWSWPHIRVWGNKSDTEREKEWRTHTYMYTQRLNSPPETIWFISYETLLMLSCYVQDRQNSRVIRELRGQVTCNF